MSGSHILEDRDVLTEVVLLFGRVFRTMKYAST